MPERIRDLPAFLLAVAALLELCSRCREVLFRAAFRARLPDAVEETSARLRELSERREVREPDPDAMRQAGLYGATLELKLEAFEAALIAFEAEGGEARLQQTLDDASIILNSIAGAIPGFGSFAQELIDFIVNELRKRIRVWPW